MLSNLEPINSKNPLEATTCMSDDPQRLKAYEQQRFSLQKKVARIQKLQEIQTRNLKTQKQKKLRKKIPQQVPNKFKPNDFFRTSTNSIESSLENLISQALSDMKFKQMMSENSEECRSLHSKKTVVVKPFSHLNVMSENGDDPGMKTPNLATAVMNEESRPHSQEMCPKNEDIASCNTSRLLARQMINPKVSNIPKLDLKSHRLERERVGHTKSRESSKIECPS